MVFFKLEDYLDFQPLSIWNMDWVCGFLNWVQLVLLYPLTLVTWNQPLTTCNQALMINKWKNDSTLGETPR